MAYCVNDILKLLFIVFVHIDADLLEEGYKGVIQINRSARISDQFEKGLGNKLFQAITPSLLIHTCICSVAALHTSWCLAGAFDFYSGVRAVERRSLGGIGGMSLLRLRQVLQALVLEERHQWIVMYCRSTGERTPGLRGVVMEPWEEEVARGRALVWLPWVCLEDCFACATCCRKRVERSEGSSAGLACALRAAAR
jgi:hypothetical protein